jgi:MFS family permease
VALTTAFFGIALGFGALSAHSNGALFLPVSHQFGWSRAEFSLSHLAAAVIGTLITPYVGRLVDRFGPRKVAATSAVLAALAFFMLSLAQGNLGLFIAMQAIAALAGAGTSAITYVALMSMWFDRARGLAIGIIMSGSGICAIVAPKLLIPFVAEAGWRAGYRALALVMLLSAPLILIGAHRPRARIGGAILAAKDLAGTTLREAIRSSRFWRQGGALTLMGLGLSGLYAHFVPLLTDHGLDPATTANVAALFGGAVFVGRLGAGYLLDRIFAPILATMFVLVAAAGLGAAMMPGVNFGAIAAVGIGLGFGTELDIAGYITARYFGRKAYGAIFGWQFAFFTAGGIVGSISYGVIHDRSGSYHAALTASIVLMLCAIPLLLSLGRYPEWKAPDEA